MPPLRLVVLVSGEGTLLQAVLDASADGRLDARVVGVGADRPARALDRANAAGIETFVEPLAKSADRAEWDQRLADQVARFQPDLVVSAGFMKLVGPAFLRRFEGRFINTHPALLPSFPGAHAVRDSLAAGVKLTGCTVFAVDAGIDTGPIIAQVGVPVCPGDDEVSLHERIKVAERRLLVDVIAGWRNHD